VYTGASGAATLASTTFTATTAIDAPETLIINASGALAVIASDAEVPAGAIVFGVLTNTDDIISFEVDAGFPLVAGVYGFANNVLTIQGAGDFTISFVGNVYSLNYGGANVGDLENRDAHTLVISSTVGGETSYETYRVNLRGLDENPIVAKSSDGDVDDNIIENSENGDVSEVTLPLTEALFDISGIDISIRAGDEPTQDERLNTATTNVDDDTANGGFIFNVTDTQNGVIELFDGTSWNVSTEFTLANVRAALVRFNHDSDEQFEKEADAPFETTTARLTQFTVTITDLTANVSTTAEIALDVTPFNDAPVGTNTANSGDSIFVLDGVSLSDIQGEEITFSGYSRDMNGDANPAITATAETATLPASITSGDTFWIWWSNGNDHTAVEVRFVEVSGNVEITTIRATEGTTASPTQAFFDGQAASLRLVDTLGNVGANIRDITIDGVDYANFVRISYSVNEQDSDSTSTGGSDDFTLNDGWLFPAWDIDNGRGDVTVTISETTTVGSIVFKGDVDGTAVEIVLDAGDTFTAQQVADGEIYYRHNGGEGIEQGDRTGEVAPTRDRDGRDTFTYTVDDGANANRGDDYTPPVFTLTFDIIAVNDAPTANPDTDTQHDNFDAYTIGDRIVQDDERVVFNAVGNVINRGVFLEGGFTDDHYTLSLADVGVYDPDHLVISAD
ncbi:MAG: hypothetical protein HAW65_07120, partial [Alphaproteobacteria bacterium]|nr:hypothetical protein [Alphaproteobacteria bacterium]